MVKKTDYDINITDIENKLNNHYHDKYITTPEFNTLAATTKNADIEKDGYSGYGTGFGQNVLIFGVHMSSSAHVDNKKKDILVLGKGPTQGLEHTLTVEKCIQLILLLRIKNFV